MGAKLRAFVATAAVIALAAIATSPMVAQSQGGGRETFTMKSLDRKTVEHEIDIDDDGSTDGAGDQIVGVAPLFRGGEKAGSERHVCSVVKPGRRAFLLRCEATFNIADRGSIEVAGILKFTRQGEEATLTITGGTAAFRGASGTVEFGTSRNATTFTFKVS